MCDLNDFYTAIINPSPLTFIVVVEKKKKKSIKHTYLVAMAEKSYMTNHDSVKSFTNLNYLNLDTHENIWKNIIDSHPFNQAVKYQQQKKTFFFSIY